MVVLGGCKKGDCQVRLARLGMGILSRARSIELVPATPPSAQVGRGGAHIAESFLDDTVNRLSPSESTEITQ